MEKGTPIINFSGLCEQYEYPHGPYSKFVDLNLTGALRDVTIKNSVIFGIANLHNYTPKVRMILLQARKDVQSKKTDKNMDYDQSIVRCITFRVLDLLITHSFSKFSAHWRCTNWSKKS